MLRIIALLAILFASPAYAVNDFAGQKFSEIEVIAKKHGIIIERLNEGDTAAMDAVVPGRPTPSTVYLLTLTSSVIIVLERDAEVIFSSDPVKLEVINRALGRSGA
jgi:hypothetical protein